MSLKERTKLCVRLPVWWSEYELCRVFVLTSPLFAYASSIVFSDMSCDKNFHRGVVPNYPTIVAWWSWHFCTAFIQRMSKQI